MQLLFPSAILYHILFSSYFLNQLILTIDHNLIYQCKCACLDPIAHAFYTITVHLEHIVLFLVF